MLPLTSGLVCGSSAFLRGAAAAAGAGAGAAAGGASFFASSASRLNDRQQHTANKRRSDSSLDVYAPEVPLLPLPDSFQSSCQNFEFCPQPAVFSDNIDARDPSAEGYGPLRSQILHSANSSYSEMRIELSASTNAKLLQENPELILSCSCILWNAAPVAQSHVGHAGSDYHVGTLKIKRDRLIVK